MTFSEDWCEGVSDATTCFEDPEGVEGTVPGSGDDLDDPYGSDPGTDEIDWGDDWEPEDGGDSGYDAGGGGGAGYDDGPEPEPYDPGFDDSSAEPMPEPAPPPGADDARYLDFYTNELERARRDARRALIEAWRRITRGELGREGRTILYRWFPGATTDDLRQINRTILGAWHALGEADLRRVTVEYRNALPRSDPDLEQISQDLRDGDVQATTFWAGRPRADYYTAVYPVFFLSPSVPYQASTILHEGVHLVDPARITDTNDRGRINNAWAYTGFVSELTGMRFFRDRALMCARIGCP